MLPAPCTLYRGLRHQASTRWNLVLEQRACLGSPRFDSVIMQGFCIVCPGKMLRDLPVEAELKQAALPQTECRARALSPEIDVREEQKTRLQPFPSGFETIGFHSGLLMLRKPLLDGARGICRRWFGSLQVWPLLCNHQKTWRRLLLKCYPLLAPLGCYKAKAYTKPEAARQNP